MFGYSTPKYVVLAHQRIDDITSEDAEWGIYDSLEQATYWKYKWRQVYHVAYVREVGKPVSTPVV